MKRIGLSLLILLILAAPAAAQSACGKDPLNPCGPLPWDVPNVFTLSSPTPYTPLAPVSVTATPTPDGTTTPDVTATPSPTVDSPTLDPGLLQTPLAEAEEAISTLAPLYDLEIPDALGNSYTMLEIAESLGSQGGTIVSIAKGMQGLNIGSLGSIITWGITAAGYAVLIYILTSTTPILLWIIEMVLKILDTVLRLLPW